MCYYHPLACNRLDTVASFTARLDINCILSDLNVPSTAFEVCLDAYIYTIFWVSMAITFF